MQVSVVFGTRGNEASILHLERIFRCLEQQTFQDFEVVLVVDQEEHAILDALDAKLHTWEKQFFGRFHLVFAGKHSGGASYVRNIGIKQAHGKLIQLFDDDNGFDTDYLQQAVEHYEQKKKECGTEVVICSTLQYRETGEIQNRGFLKWDFWQNRAIVCRAENHFSCEIRMFSGNGLLGDAKLFKQMGYDEEIARIAEDLDFTLSLREKGVRFFSFLDLPVRHYEREKTILQQAWIGTYEQARQKARNWFSFLKKHATFWNKVQFYLVGLPGCIVWLSLKALRFGGKGKWQIIQGLWSGILAGMK